MYRVFNEDHFIDEYRFRKKNGQYVWVRDERTLYRDFQGEPMEIVGTWIDINERKKAEKRVRDQLQRVKSLNNIEITIANSLDLNLTMKTVAKITNSELGVDAASVLLFKPYCNMLEYVSGEGFKTDLISKEKVQLGSGFAGRAALEYKRVYIPDIAETQCKFVRIPLFSTEGFCAYVAEPLLAKGQIKGVLEIFHRSSLNPDDDWFDFLGTIAGQAAIAIDSAQSFEELQQSNISLSLAYDDTIEGWSRAMDLRDKETEGHTQRVTELSVRLARVMGLRNEEIVHIRHGALLHDMGKLGIPDYILHKPGRLNEEEWVIMRQHPQFAYDMLSSIDYLRPAMDIPYCHHEKWDGSGYPRGLKGAQIPIAARIFAVVDVWDALTSDRPYRAAWPRKKALAHINSLAGIHFDPQVVELFLQMMNEQQQRPL